jgi:exosome complex protein LRP1
VDAKQHPVFRELTRVKQYFEKIKALETEPEERSMTLDKAAANRFIKHGLVSVDLFYRIAMAIDRVFTVWQ